MIETGIAMIGIETGTGIEIETGIVIETAINIQNAGCAGIRNN